jgi:hypothetical protein
VKTSNVSQNRHFILQHSTKFHIKTSKLQLLVHMTPGSVIEEICKEDRAYWKSLAVRDCILEWGSWS